MTCAYEHAVIPFFGGGFWLRKCLRILKVFSSFEYGNCHKIIVRHTQYKNIANLGYKTYTTVLGIIVVSNLKLQLVTVCKYTREPLEL
jgi:hypothetical protein